MLRSLVVAAVLCMAGPLPVGAQVIVTSRYTVTTFNGKQGLPGNQIYAIDQSPDGYLWVATNNGLARFDGYEFEDLTTRIRPPLNFPLITSVSAGHPGPVAAMAYNGRGAGPEILFVQGDSLIRHESDFNPSEPVSEFRRDGAGRMWSVVSNRVLYLTDAESGTSRHVNFGPDTFAHELTVDRHGQAWMLTANEPSVNPEPCGAVSARSWRIHRLDESGSVYVADTANSQIVHDAGSGSIVATERRGDRLLVRTMDGETTAVFFVPASACPLAVTAREDLWVRDGAQLVRYAAGNPQPQDELAVSLRTAAETVVFQDREGTLWIGTYTQGLLRIRMNPVRVISTTPVVDEATIRLAPGGDGSVLLIDPKYAVFKATGSESTDDITPLPLPRRSVPFERSPAERLEFSDESSAQGRRLIITRSLPGAPPQTIVDIPSQSTDGESFEYADDEAHNVLFWTRDDVLLLTDPFGENPSYQILTQGKTSIRDALLEPDGALWVATESGLYRVDGTTETRFSRDTGAPSSHFRSLHTDGTGTLWAGTYGQGLLRFNGVGFDAVTEHDGLFENVISAILEDDHGNLWMNGNEGIQRVALHDLRAFLDGEAARVPITSFAAESGLVNPESTGSRAIKAGDGTLWFPTFFGAGIVDPNAPLHADPNSRPPLIQSVSVDGVNVLRPGSGARLMPDQRRFTVSYSGMGLRNPELQRYRYRLDGFDPGWIDAEKERRAVYTNVPPGEYVFRLQSRSGTADWIEEAAVARIVVTPRFFETKWFWSLMVLTGGLWLYVAYRVRIQHLYAREQALNRIVQERTDDLTREKETVAAQAEELRSLDEAKSRLFANVSHEFRTPLTLILGPLEDMRAGMHGALTASAHRQVQAAIRNGQRLLTLINQLLDVSRMETNQFRLEARPVDLCAFTEHICAAFRLQAERHDHPFSIRIPDDAVRVYIDPEHFQKVLTNLLGNAFKFTPPGRAITVEVQSVSDGAVLQVSDEGPGMDPAEAERAFDRFYQADTSTTRRRDGTGIGLALVKSLVERHGGTVELVSAPGEGSTFTIRLPLGHAHLSPDEVFHGEEGDVPPAFALLPAMTDAVDEHANSFSAVEVPISPDADVNTTVLVVDDHADVRAYIRTHLAPRYRVIEASNGQEALECVRRSLPDLVISDVMMPDMDGFALCAAIKQDQEVDFIPVLLLTARASHDSRLEGLGLGADDYLTKPFDMRELLIRVENILVGRQRLKRHYDAQAIHPRPRAVDPDVDRALSIIEERLSEDGFTIQDLAEAVGLGRTTLFRRFREALDQAPMDYLWDRRLVRAQKMLSSGSGTVSEVAYGVGFKSVAHFSTRFREKFGTPPSEVTSDPH